MKIAKVILKGYNQFNNLEIDLTYPKGHEKEGKPLDKICFIGQSGTGKTSLLRLIKYFVSYSKAIGSNVNLPDIPKDKVTMKIVFDDIEYEVTPGIRDDGTSTMYISKTKKDGKDIQYEEWLISSNKHKEEVIPRLINYPTEILGEYTSHSNSEVTNSTEEKEAYLDNLSPGKIIDFAFDEKTLSWNYVLKEIKSHKAHGIFLKTKIADLALNEDSLPKDIQAANKKYQIWVKRNPDPLKKLAEKCLNPLLLKLGLKVKLDFNYETILNLGTIELQTLSGEDVPRNFWSTGTKHIIDTAIPLYEIKPSNAVILMDEPERSLYPDIQEFIIDFYTNLVKDCQFLFATHSPIIAASFDPWEIIELKFDDKNQYVLQNQYYEGERHLNNFIQYPKYLRWDAILMKLFDLKDDGNTKYREKELLNGVTLKNLLSKMKDEGKENTKEYLVKYDLYIQTAKKLGWDL